MLLIHSLDAILSVEHDSIPTENLDGKFMKERDTHVVGTEAKQTPTGSILIIFET